MIIHLPEGFRVEREEQGSYLKLSVYECGGPTWKDGSPRSLIEVDVWPPVGGRGGPRVSWPSTSDKRPELAVALAYALGVAAWYVDRAEEWFEGECPVELDTGEFT